MFQEEREWVNEIRKREKTLKSEIRKKIFEKERERGRE